MIETVISSRVGPNLAELQFLQSHDPFRLSTLNARSSSYITRGRNTCKKERERERKEEMEKAEAINLLENFCNQTASQVAIGRDVFNKIYARSCR